MTAQAFEFDGTRGYRFAGRSELSDDQLAAALVAQCAFDVLLGHCHDLVMEACNA